MAKDAYYFPHDSNAKDDPKAVLLIEQLGLEGYGIYWVLIETLRDQPSYRYPLNLIGAIARRYLTSSEKVAAVIRNYRLFEVEDEEFFLSPSLRRRMERINNKRLLLSEAGKKGRAKQLQLSASTPGPPPGHSSATPGQSKQNKTKQIAIATRLRDIVLLRRKRTITEKTISDWFNQIRLLVEKDSRSLEEINISLDWYEKHWGDEYVPVIESAKSLREKYDKLLNAISRGGGSVVSLKPNCKTCEYNQKRACPKISEKGFDVLTCEYFKVVDNG